MLGTIVQAHPGAELQLWCQDKVRVGQKGRGISRRLFADFDAIVDGCRGAWKRLLAEPGRLASLTNYPCLQKVRTS